jgi:hypothetical protein
VLKGQPASVQLLALSAAGGVTYLLLAHTLKLVAFTQLRAGPSQHDVIMS